MTITNNPTIAEVTGEHLPDIFAGAVLEKELRDAGLPVNSITCRCSPNGEGDFIKIDHGPGPYSASQLDTLSGVLLHHAPKTPRDTPTKAAPPPPPYRTTHIVDPNDAGASIIFGTHPAHIIGATVLPRSVDSGNYELLLSADLDDSADNSFPFLIAADSHSPIRIPIATPISFSDIAQVDIMAPSVEANTRVLVSLEIEWTPAS